MGLIKKYSEVYASKSHDEMSLTDYLKLCKKDNLAYASSAERLLKAIGEPDVVDTSTDARLSRIFLNRTIKVYPAFNDFYGMEEAIERLVSYFRQSAQGLEEKKQIQVSMNMINYEKTPIHRVFETIKSNKLATDKELEKILSNVKLLIEESVKFAENSPEPKPDELYKDVYKQEDYPFIKE